ncbi:nuclear transport factor 2 family protein [Sediminibacterium sp.]|uniref:nuclear transport factor 2 family protein n=1 Tax=Sediminibacterium sp. TaxID=1917865 RepID=UPI003F702C3E
MGCTKCCPSEKAICFLFIAIAGPVAVTLININTISCLSSMELIFWLYSFVLSNQVNFKNKKMENKTITPTETVKIMFAAFGAGKMDELKKTLSEDTVWVYHSTDEIPYNGTYVGKDEVLKFIGNIITHVDIEGFQTNHFFENGNRVVVLGSEKQRIKKNGELLEQDWVQSFIVENGLITRLDEYANTSHAAQLFSK